MIAGSLWLSARRWHTVAAVLLNAACLVILGCGPNSEGAARRSQPAPIGYPSVALSSDQIRAIKIAPVTSHTFHFERDEIGTVSEPIDPALVQAESTLISAAASFRSTTKELARVRSLGQTNGIAPKELEQTLADQQTAAGTLTAARVALRVLGKSEVEIDRMIAAGKIEVPTGHEKWVTVYAPESDSFLFHSGQSVAISLSALPSKAFHGEVREVYATADADTHRVTIRCEVPDPAGILRSGMLANVAIQTEEPQNSLALPANGVVREGDGVITAWVTSDRHHFQQQIIQAGLREDGYVQILKGLRPGELAVTDGALFLDNMLNAPPSD